MLASAPAIPSCVTRHREAPADPSAPPALPATVRAVAAVDLPGVVPAPLAGVCEPIFDRLRPGDLLVDEAYQREISPKSLRLIRRIVEQWDWLRFKAPVVALTDLGFEIIDGQHSAIAAACHPGIETIPVLVVDGSDLQRRARAFVSHTVDRMQARPVQVWHAAVAAGDEDATTIRNVLDRSGVKLLAHNPQDRPWAPGETMALAAVRRLVDRRGAMRAREVLEVVAAARLAPIQAEHIRATESLLLDPEYAGGLDAARITAALRDLTPKQTAEAKEFAFAKRLPVWRALAAVLYRAHAAAPKRGRAKAADAAPPVPAAPVPVLAAPATPATPATPDVEAPLVPSVDDAPAVDVAEGVAHWRRGEPWSAAWGPPPDDAACAVPGALLGPVVLIVGVPRTEAAIARVVSLWHRDGRWPAGWGPPPSDPGCAMPLRFREVREAA